MGRGNENSVYGKNHSKNRQADFHETWYVASMGLYFILPVPNIYTMERYSVTSQLSSTQLRPLHTRKRSEVTKCIGVQVSQLIKHAANLA